MTINVSADLFRIAALCQSDEQTRYYLNGVYVEPHVNGATLVATNGHYLLAIHDASATCDKPAIVQLSRDALRACKPARKDAAERRVCVENDKAFVRMVDDLAVSPRCLVDGAFPDWRNVVKQTQIERDPDAKQPTFDQHILRVMCDVARELTAANGKHGILVNSKNEGGPAFVTFEGAPHAFALIMPMRNDDRRTQLPSWYLSPAPIAAAA